VVSGFDAADQPATPGVDSESTTRTVGDAELAAIVSDVPLESFGEEALKENLNDVAWLEQTARRHEQVLDEALARATVVPLRLCTIYRGEDEVCAMLQRERGPLLEALERLAGKTEWGVKMIAAPGVLAAAGESPSGSDQAAEDLTPGMAYMDAKRRAASASEDIHQLAERWAASVHEPLSGIASEALLNPLQNPELAGYEGDMLLNGVYLVDVEHEAEFRRLTVELEAEWRQRDVSVELTGPWPPYNFVKSSIEAAR
jgi:hypothetical protein